MAEIKAIRREKERVIQKAVADISLYESEIERLRRRYESYGAELQGIHHDIDRLVADGRVSDSYGKRGYEHFRERFYDRLNK